MSLQLSAASSQYASVASGVGLGTNDTEQYTFAVWFKRGRTSHSSEERLITRGYAASSTTYAALNIQTSNEVRCQSFYTAGDNTTGGTQISDTATWHLAVGRYPRRDGSDNSGLRLSVDGTEATADTSLRTNTGQADTFNLGRNSGATPSLFFDGKLAHVAVWNCHLSSAEIAELLTKTPDSITYDTNSSANLLAYWPLLDSYVDSVGGYTLSGANSPSFDSVDGPSLSSGGPPPDTTDAPYLIVPRRQLFVSRRVIQH